MIIYAHRQDLGDLGSWFSRTISNVGKVIQQTDLVSHAAHDLGIGKSTVGKILVPTASNNVDKHQTIVKKEQTKPVLQVVNSANCAKSEFSSDPRCVEFMKTQQTVTTSQNIISAKEGTTSTKTKVIVGGGLLLSAVLIVLANKKPTKN